MGKPPFDFYCTFVNTKTNVSVFVGLLTCCYNRTVWPTYIWTTYMHCYILFGELCTSDFDERIFFVAALPQFPNTSFPNTLESISGELVLVFLHSYNSANSRDFPIYLKTVFLQHDVHPKTKASFSTVLHLAKKDGREWPKLNSYSMKVSLKVG